MTTNVTTKTTAAIAGVVGRLLAGGVVDAGDLARALGTTVRSVARWQAEASLPRRRSEERLLEVATVVEALEASLAVPDARLWLRRPHPELGWDKPLERIAEGGYRDVLAAAPEGERAP